MDDTRNCDRACGRLSTRTKAVNFVDLYKWVMALPNSDDPKRCGERILEAISRPGSRKPNDQQGLKVLFRRRSRSGSAPCWRVAPL
jgi:hypothetical protein